MCCTLWRRRWKCCKSRSRDKTFAADGVGQSTVLRQDISCSKRAKLPNSNTVTYLLTEPKTSHCVYRSCSPQFHMLVLLASYIEQLPLSAVHYGHRAPPSNYSICRSPSVRPSNVIDAIIAAAVASFRIRSPVRRPRADYGRKRGYTAFINNADDFWRTVWPSKCFTASDVTRTKPIIKLASIAGPSVHPTCKPIDVCINSIFCNGFSSFSRQFTAAVRNFL